MSLNIERSLASRSGRDAASDVHRTPDCRVGGALQAGSLPRPILARDVPDLTFELSDSEAAAVHFRQTFGLPSDVALVKAAESDPTYSPEDYGVPVSASERAELQRRARFHVAIEPAYDYAASQATFGGLYYDQRERGIAIFQFTEPPARFDDSLRARLPEGGEFRTVQVERSLGELESLRDSVGSRWDELARQDIQINSTGIKGDRNAVIVGIDGLTPAIERLLDDMFGPGLIYEESSPAVIDVCTSEHNCRPMKGGLHIESSINQAVACTAGFIVRREQNGAQLSVLTAGHCIEIAREPNENTIVNDDWQHNNDPFGDAKYETWLGGANADVGIIGLHSSEISTMTNKNQLALKATNSSPVSIRNVTSVLAPVYQTVGLEMCRYGMTTDSVCDAITATGVQRKSCRYGNTGCKWIMLTWEYGVDSKGGDSGGPVYVVVSSTDRVALGTHIHSSDETQDPQPWRSWYSPIGVAQSTYDSMYNDWFTLCQDSDC